MVSRVFFYIRHEVFLIKLTGHSRPRVALNLTWLSFRPFGPLSFVYTHCSKSMAHNCSLDAELQQVETGFVDLGIGPDSAHTAFSKNPDTFVNAFVD